MLEIILIILLVRISSNFKDAGKSGASNYIVPVIACMVGAIVFVLIGRSSESIPFMVIGLLCYIPALILAIHGLNKSKMLSVETNASMGYAASRAVAPPANDPLSAKLRGLVDVAQPAQLNKVIRVQTCPVCGSGADRIRPLGAKGSRGTSAAVTVAFGAVGNLIAQQNSAGKMTSMPIEYKCSCCKSKFQIFSEYATPEELLQRPAVIVLTRASGMLGAAVERFVLLNGIKVARVKNNREVSFQTNVRTNELLMLDQYDATADVSPLRFEVADGEIIQVFWNGKTSRITRRIPAENLSGRVVAKSADADAFQTVAADQLFFSGPAVAVAIPATTALVAEAEPVFAAPEFVPAEAEPVFAAPEFVPAEPEPVLAASESVPAVPEPVFAVPQAAVPTIEPEKESIPAFLESNSSVLESAQTIAPDPASAFLDDTKQPLPVVPEKSALPGHGFCFRCGAPLKPEAKFCHACGTTIKRGIRPES